MIDHRNPTEPNQFSRMTGQTNNRRENDPMLDPARAFESPADILACRELCREKKLALLEQWRHELESYLVAEDESMTGNPNNAERLKQVSDALIALEQE